MADILREDINHLLYDSDDLKQEKVNGGFFDFIKAWFLNDITRHMFFEDEIIIAQKLNTMSVVANTYQVERKRYFDENLKDSQKQKGIFKRIKDRDFAFYRDPVRVKLWGSITDTEVYMFFIKSSVNQMLGGGNIAQLTSLPKFKFNAKLALSVNTENVSASAKLLAAGKKSFLGSSCINIWSNLPLYDSSGKVVSFTPLYLRMSGKASSSLFNYSVDASAKINKMNFMNAKSLEILDNFKGNINLKVITAKGSSESKSFLYAPRFNDNYGLLNDLGFIKSSDESYRYLAPIASDGLDLIREYTYPEIEQIYFGRSALSGYSKTNYKKQSLGLKKNGEGLMTLAQGTKDYQNPLIQVKTSTKASSLDLFSGQIKGKILAGNLIGFANIKGAVNKFRNKVESVVKKNISESFESPLKIPNLSEFGDMEIKARFGLYSKQSASKLRTIRISIPMKKQMLDFNKANNSSYKVKSGMGLSMLARHDLKGAKQYKAGLLERTSEKMFTGQKAGIKDDIKSTLTDLTKEYTNFGSYTKQESGSLIENATKSAQKHISRANAGTSNLGKTNLSTIYDKNNKLDKVVKELIETYKIEGLQGLQDVDSNEIIKLLSKKPSLGALSSSFRGQWNELKSKLKDIDASNMKQKVSEAVLSTQYEKYKPMFNKAQQYKDPDAFYVQDTLINYSQTLKQENFKDQVAVINIIEFGSDGDLPILFEMCNLVTNQSAKDEAKQILGKQENASKVKDLLSTLKNTITVISPESNISYVSINALCDKAGGDNLLENQHASSISLGSTISLADFNRTYSLDAYVSKYLGISPLEHLSKFSLEKEKNKIVFEEYFIKLAIKKYMEIMFIDHDEEEETIKSFITPVMELQKNILNNLVVLNKELEWKSNSVFKKFSGALSFASWVQERLPGFDFMLSQQYSYLNGLVLNFTTKEDSSPSETVVKLCRIVRTTDALVRGFYSLLRRMIKNKNGSVGSHNVSDSHLNIVRHVLTSLSDPYKKFVEEIDASIGHALLSGTVNFLNFMDSFVEVQRLGSSIGVPTDVFFTLVYDNKTLLKDICYTVEKMGVTGIVFESTFNHSLDLLKVSQNKACLKIKKSIVTDYHTGQKQEVSSIDREGNTELMLQNIYDNIAQLDKNALGRLFRGFRILKQENVTNTDKSSFNIGLSYDPIANDVSVKVNKDNEELYSYNNLSKDEYVKKISNTLEAKISLGLGFEHEEVRGSQGFSVLATIPNKTTDIDSLNRQYRPMIWV